MTENLSSRVGESVRGYTLVEMLVVLTVVGLLIAAFPAVMSAGRNAVQTRTAAQMLANDLRTARRAAISENRETDIVFDLAKNTYLVRPGSFLRHIPAVLKLEFTDANGLSFFDGAGFRFFSDGSSSGGTIKISIQKESHSVVAHALTGRVTIDE